MPIRNGLEPTERDPKRLRRTAWILVAVMVVGGFAILKAYEAMAKNQAKDSRPAMVHRIRQERDLRIVTQDGKTHDLHELRGSVVLLHAISHKHPEDSNRALEVMKRAAAKFAGRSDVRFVSLIVDPIPAAELTRTLESCAAERGMDPGRWWLGSNESATLHKFMKNELKMHTFPHEQNGRWIFDTSVILIDREGNLRRAVVPQQRGGPPYIASFDFAQAAAWDEQGALTNTERTNQEELEHLLLETTERVLNETKP
jgi:cytochrome oxidase Cu insertion factor (SCO1/SenC/PrrC family)